MAELPDGIDNPTVHAVIAFQIAEMAMKRWVVQEDHDQQKTSGEIVIAFTDLYHKAQNGLYKEITA